MLSETPQTELDTKDLTPNKKKLKKKIEMKWRKKLKLKLLWVNSTRVYLIATRSPMLNGCPTAWAMNTAATASYSAVPSIFIVAPIGRTKRVTRLSTWLFSSKQRNVTGKVAALRTNREELLGSSLHGLSSLGNKQHTSVRNNYCATRLGCHRRVELGNIKGKGCMVETGHKDTGFPIETIGPSHDTSTFISF